TAFVAATVGAVGGGAAATTGGTISWTETAGARGGDVASQVARLAPRSTARCTISDSSRKPTTAGARPVDRAKTRIAGFYPPPSRVAREPAPRPGPRPVQALRRPNRRTSAIVTSGATSAISSTASISSPSWL